MDDGAVPLPLLDVERGVRRYCRQSYRVPEELADEAAAELWAAGTLGVEIVEQDDCDVRLEAYFSETPPPGLLADDGWAERGVRPLAGEWLEERDWLEEFRRQSRPFELGTRFVVDPREPAEPDGEGATMGERIPLRLPARCAFGIGSHASTELVVEALEELPVRGRRVLDVGFGTGILCFVALHLGARSAAGCECDLESALVGALNRRLNRQHPRLFVGRIGALGPGARFELILLNVLPERIDGELEDLVPHLERGGTLVVSGLLEEQRLTLEARYERLGLRVRERRTTGEWASLVLEYRPE